MTFLQPLLLAALPLIALPILIHLINQRRYQTVRWGAMMFLLAANRMSRGYAKLRQWLILAFRTLAIAGLIFAISRPLASGWLGLAAGGRADTTLILLDRSPSMSQQGSGTVLSKLDAGRQQLARTLKMLGSTRWVLIESTSHLPQEIESPDALLKLSSTEPTSVSADLPTMLEAARDYVKANKVGRTEIWICSDIRRNDWNAESGRWQALRDSFLEFAQGIRFHLLAYPDTAANNVAVRVTNVRRQQGIEGAELLVSLKLTQEAGNETKRTIPVQFEIQGARSQTDVELAGAMVELKDHRIPLEQNVERGWGKVSIPADANPADDSFYFVFAQPPQRQTVIISDDPPAMRPLQLAASITPDPALQGSAEILGSDQLASVEWEKVAMLLWHAPLPVGEAAQSLQAFLDRGGQVVFFPPQVPGDGEFLGTSWQAWREENTDVPIETWRGDQDVLANTQSGAALPVGQLQVRRFCSIRGEVTPLASLKGGTPLLARVPTTRGGVYFCATTPAGSDSSLATNGVVLYVLVQRVLGTGAAVLGSTQQLIAGDSSAEQPNTWQQVAGPPEAISTDYAFHGGVYSAGERLLALNRAPPEDQAGILGDPQVSELFQGLDFARVDDRAGSLAALIQEIWRLFLITMIIALIVEAVLCLPRKVAAQQPVGGAG